MWAYRSDRFCPVQFSEVVIDVLWSSLEVVDPEFLRAQVEAREGRDTGLREHPVSARKVLGPRGGFRRLVVSYFRGDGVEVVVPLTDKDEAAYVEGLLESVGFPVEVVGGGG